ncbi:MAG TPA: hypothetical protein VKB14_16560 [Actinomycetales bacterium]|nr:hypothetical protein [Actinomycetales bacterium]
MREEGPKRTSAIPTETTSAEGAEEPLSQRVREAYREEVDHTHESLLNAAIAFTFTFATLRGLTYSIKYDLVPWGNIVAGGVHLHHYVWGVMLLLVVGMVSLIVDSPRYNPVLGIVYGIATALVVDEFALLLNLRDVYWTNEGRISIDVALTTIAVALVYFLAKAFWRRLGRELLRSLRRHVAKRRA